MAGWTKQQTVSNNNGATAAASVSATLAATQQNSLLVAAICCAVAGASITPPAGWIRINNLMPTTPAGGTVGLFYLLYNPGGITSVAFTITSSLAAVVISEYIGGSAYPTQALLDQTGQNGSTNGTQVPGAGFGLVQEANELAVYVIGYINNTVLTHSGFPAGYSIDGSNIGTAAAGNAGVILVSNPDVGYVALGAGGTLSAAPTDGPTTISGTFLSFPLQGTNLNIGPVNDLPGGEI